VKRDGILHAGLAREVARLGHTHRVVVADCGLPLPRGGDAAVVDLALTPGVPTFTQVLDALLAEIVVEAATIADEARGGPVEQWVARRGLAPSAVPHEQLKDLTAGAALVVRTGEATPFANVVLRCGVPF
jgi:D-ribose pyranase